MLGSEGEMDTEHSIYPVPFLVIDNRFSNNPQVLPTGKLGDIAPTILALMGIEIPSVMTGKNLIIDMIT